MVDAPRSARARARAELTQEILDEARRQLAEVGPAALSLRSVARALGMVSSALYRYFPSRDDLLTALIVEAYDAMGEAAEAADAARPRADLAGRWLAVCRAVRSWAVEHPHQYALVFGSPVPGYAAPQDTIGPATRTPAVLLAILSDGVRMGVIVDDPPAAAKARRAVAPLQSFAPDVPSGVLVRGVTAWEGLFGAVTFELFGHLHNVVDPPDRLFDHQMVLLGRLLGLD